MAEYILEMQNNTEEIIELDIEQFQEFHERLGSESFQIQSRIFEDYGKKKLDIYFKSVGFTTVVIGTAGLIAGFGFTAINEIQSGPLFFIGEALLLSSIFYGLFWIQGIYQAEFRSIEKELERLRDFYDKRNEKYMVLYNEWMLKKSITKSNLKELQGMENKSIDLFKTPSQSSVPVIYSPIMYGLMTFGAAALLSSFFIYSLLSDLCRLLLF